MDVKCIGKIAGKFIMAYFIAKKFAVKFSKMRQWRQYHLLNMYENSFNFCIRSEIACNYVVSEKINPYAIKLLIF